MADFSILEFVAKLGEMGAELVLVEVEALERGALIIEKEAKASVGTYQNDSPPFAGWAQLADFTMADRVAQGFPEDEPELRTGRMRDTIEHKVNAWLKEADIGSDDEILEWQELGTVHMPPRSILGGAAARKADEIAETIGSDINAVLIGDEVHLGRMKIT